MKILLDDYEKNLYSYAANLRCFTGLASMMQRYEIFMDYARNNAVIFQKNAESEVTHLLTFDICVFHLS